MAKLGRKGKDRGKKGKNILNHISLETHNLLLIDVITLGVIWPQFRMVYSHIVLNGDWTGNNPYLHTNK